MPITPAAHHRLWLRLLCDDQIKRLLIIAPPESAKPVSVDALVTLASGERRRLGDIRVGDRVLTHLGHAKPVTAVHEQGTLPLIRLRTYNGRVIEAAADHPFMTPAGWINAGDLRPGMALAVLGTPAPEPRTSTLPDEAFRLAGYIVGDGAVTLQKNYSMNATITCADPVQGADIVACVERLGFNVVYDGNITYRLSGGIRAWLRETGLAGASAHTKRIPSWVFAAAPAQVAQFLGAYFACDGHISTPGKGRVNPQIEITSVSDGLLKDVQHALTRFGIMAKLRDMSVRYNHERRRAYRLTTNSRDDVVRFTRTIPVFGRKQAVLRAWDRPEQRFFTPWMADPVESVESVAAGPCRCLTVADDHTFLANDVIVRNTTWAVSAFLGCYIGVFPERSVIIGSASGPIAEKRSLAIRNAVESPLWAESFPAAKRAVGMGWTGSEWSIARGGVPHPGRLHPTLAAYGTGGPVIGSRADLVLADDLLDFENTRTAYQRELVDQWLHTSFLSRRKARTGRSIVIGTAWHHDDLYARASRDGGWVVVKTPILSETSDVYATITYPDEFPYAARLGTPVAATEATIG